MANDVEHISMCLYASCIFHEMPIHAFVEWIKKKKKTLEMEFSIYYVHDLLSEIYDLQIFSPSAACISNLTVFLERKS